MKRERTLIHVRALDHSSGGENEFARCYVEFTGYLSAEDDTYVIIQTFTAFVMDYDREILYEEVDSGFHRVLKSAIIERVESIVEVEGLPEEIKE